MHKLTVIAGIVAGFALAGPASASLLGLPAQFPLLSFDNTGTTGYDATSDVLRVDASPIALRLDAGSTPLFVTPFEDSEFVAISILVDDTGALAGSGPGPADLAIFGRVDLGGGDVREGLLLVGVVTGFGFQDNGATDLFDFSFAVEGGALAGLFGGPLTVTMQSERSSFVNSFGESFGGGAKGTIGVVPEPTTMLLLGLGVGGLSLAGRRRTA